jgi:hypothetical protein
MFQIGPAQRRPAVAVAVFLEYLNSAGTKRSKKAAGGRARFAHGVAAGHLQHV